MENLVSGKEYDNLYRSAKARSQADWVAGINASQALSISAGYGVWSLGRVQTPTLAMICSRYLENKDFKPQTYFQVKLHTAKDATAFAAISIDRYDTKQNADTILERVRSAESVSVKRRNEASKSRAAFALRLDYLAKRSEQPTQFFSR
jgi:DNA topoisomerase-3